MEKQIVELVGGLLSRHIAEDAFVLDIGSRIESVDYTHLVAERGWRYVGNESFMHALRQINIEGR